MMTRLHSTLLDEKPALQSTPPTPPHLSLAIQTFLPLDNHNEAIPRLLVFIYLAHICAETLVENMTITCKIPGVPCHCVFSSGGVLFCGMAMVEKMNIMQ